MGLLLFVFVVIRLVAGNEIPYIIEAHSMPLNMKIVEPYLALNI